MRRIVLTGPESTGKTILSQALAVHFNGISVPEYAREYIGKLKRPYTETDVLEIARVQINQYEKVTGSNGYVIFDTWLIITKVWLEVVFNSRVDWIDNAIRDYQVDLFLLCAPDIPWEPDPLRENGGEMRETLFGTYRNTIEQQGLSYRIIHGTGPERLNNAIFAVEQFFKQPGK